MEQPVHWLGTMHGVEPIGLVLAAVAAAAHAVTGHILLCNIATPVCAAFAAVVAAAAAAAAAAAHAATLGTCWL